MVDVPRTVDGKDIPVDIPLRGLWVFEKWYDFSPLPEYRMIIPRRIALNYEKFLNLEGILFSNSLTRNRFIPHLLLQPIAHGTYPEVEKALTENLEPGERRYLLFRPILPTPADNNTVDVEIAVRRYLKGNRIVETEWQTRLAVGEKVPIEHIAYEAPIMAHWKPQKRSKPKKLPTDLIAMEDGQRRLSAAPHLSLATQAEMALLFEAPKSLSFNAGTRLDRIFRAHHALAHANSEMPSLLDLVALYVFDVLENESSDFYIFKNISLPAYLASMQPLGDETALSLYQVIDRPNIMANLGAYLDSERLGSTWYPTNLVWHYLALTLFFRCCTKAELHAHTSGSVPAETIIRLGQRKTYLNWSELSQRYGVDIRKAIMDGDVDTISNLIRYQRKGGERDLESYRALMNVAQMVMDDKEAIEQIAFDIAEQSYADGVRALELRFSPTSRQGMDPTEVVYAVMRGLKRAHTEHPDLETKIIIIVMKDLSRSKSIELARLIERWRKDPELKDYIAGIDTAGKELGYRERRHREAFQIATRAGLIPESHAGEAFRTLEGGLSSITDAIRILGVRRIGHALALGMNPERFEGQKDGWGELYTPRRIGRIRQRQKRIAETMLERNIAVTVCPTSNRHTANIPFGEHPVARLIQLGIPVALSSDNQVTSGTTLSEEFVRLAWAHVVGFRTLLEIVGNGMKYRLSQLAA